jgi:hypothetical protein
VARFDRREKPRRGIFDIGTRKPRVSRTILSTMNSIEED